MMINSNVGLCILITNAFIERWSGSELYISDVAKELIKRGHKPIVYSPRIGDLAHELRSKSIPVVTDLNSIKVKPDLIHGQHHLETMTALAHFSGTPAVFFCHGWLPWEETPPLHPRIVQYVTVSDALRDRLIYECGIPAKKVATILNSVDLERFLPRPPLPSIPKRALVFNSPATEGNIMEVIRKACARHRIVVNVIGYGSGRQSFHPESGLGNYDIIFAVGRSALEGLAIGAAVICCGIEGLGQMVTTQNLDTLRRNNFGIRVLDRPLTIDFLSAEIQKYDPSDALKVSQQVRATAGLSEMVDRILAVYNTTLTSWEDNHEQDLASENLAFASYLKGISERIYLAQRAGTLQRRLEIIRSSMIWKLYERAARNPLLRKIYTRGVVPILQQRARRKKKMDEPPELVD